MVGALGLLVLIAVASLIGFLIAGVLVAAQWTIEGALRCRVGVYFGYAELLIVLIVIAFAYYKIDEACGVGSRTCIDGGEFLALAGAALIGSLGLIVMPIVLLSTLRLSKWSASRQTF